MCSSVVVFTTCNMCYKICTLALIFCLLEISRQYKILRKSDYVNKIAPSSDYNINDNY